MSEQILTSLQEIIDSQHLSFDNLELKQKLKEILWQLDPAPDATFFVPPDGPDAFHIGNYTRKMMAGTSQKKDKKSTLIPTGFRALDKLMGGGLENGELVVLGGRPGMGKTTLMLSVAGNVVEKAGLPVFYMCSDDEAATMLKRLHALVSGISAQDLAEGTTESTWNRYIDALGTIEKFPLYLDDSHPAYIERIMDACRWMKAEQEIRLICIGNLQSVRTARSFRTRDLELGYICRRLKELSRELETTILAESHLSRQVENRGGTKRPILADLRDSGNIELEADKVLFLYRPEYYRIDVDEAGNSVMQLAELILAKNRTGKTGSVLLKRDADFTKFIDFDKYTDELTIRSGRLEDLEEGDIPF